MPSFRRSRSLSKSNTFGQMQELTNENNSDIKLYSILHIRSMNLLLIKKESTITFPDLPLAGAASLSFKLQGIRE